MLLEVSSLIMTGWLGAGSFVAFIQLQMIEVLINIFRRILIEPPKGKLLSKHHVGGAVERAVEEGRGTRRVKGFRSLYHVLQGEAGPQRPGSNTYVPRSKLGTAGWRASVRRQAFGKEVAGGREQAAGQ